MFLITTCNLFNDLCDSLFAFQITPISYDRQLKKMKFHLSLKMKYVTISPLFTGATPESMVSRGSYDDNNS
jgi:hypothetical protein